MTKLNVCMAGVVIYLQAGSISLVMEMLLSTGG